jgi:hypothetical protein
MRAEASQGPAGGRAVSLPEGAGDGGRGAKPGSGDIAAAIAAWLDEQGFAPRRERGKTGAPVVAATHPYHPPWRIAVAEDAEGIASAFYAAAAMRPSGGEAARIGLATGRSAAAERALAAVKDALDTLGIAVLRVGPSRTVEWTEPNAAGSASDGLRPDELDASNDD